MVFIVVAIVLGYLIFSKTSTTSNTTNLPVQQNVSSDLMNQGGTSTPVPTANIPVFYQQDNAATEASPTTTLSVDKSGSIASKQESIRALTPYRINPIPLLPISDSEYTSVYQERANSYINNGVGDLSVPTENVINEPIGVSNLKPLVTNNHPASVPHGNTVFYHEQAAQIAPNPPVNVKLEKIVPVVASKLKTPTKVIPPSLQRQSIYREL